MTEYSIQQLSEQTSLPRRTIHFYVQQGLIPPPDGAGVGTRYFDIHLLCLRLITLLKRGGFRLDEIRTRLQGKDESELSTLILDLDVPATPAPTFLPTSQPFAHYGLPAGMTLLVPASLNSAERQKLTELLKAVSEIFSE
jgi:DNA-binding transcriptional MerR regulator